jgi:rubrerythrin
MSILKAEPPAPVRSLGELFAIALTLEIEAGARYAELAQNMRGLGLPEVAAVFDRLVAEESSHAEEIGRWSREATGTPADPRWLRWHPPDVFDEETAQSIASSRLASAYRALSLAVRNEERAFLLWTYIAAQAEDPAIRAAAEAVAIEELRHAAMLRRERRRAFHAARSGAAPARPAMPPEAVAGVIEQELAAGLAALAQAPAMAAWAADLQRLAAEARELAAASPAETPEVASEAPSLEAMRRHAERAAELYLEAADAARDEQALLHLLSRADRAIARIARLAAMAAGG